MPWSRRSFVDWKQSHLFNLQTKGRSVDNHYLPGLHKNIILSSFSFPCLWIFWFNCNLIKKSQFFNWELTKCPVTFFSCFFISFSFFIAVSPTEYKLGIKFIANSTLMSREHRKKYRALWGNQVHFIVIQPKSSLRSRKLFIIGFFFPLIWLHCSHLIICIIKTRDLSFTHHLLVLFIKAKLNKVFTYYARSFSGQLSTSWALWIILTSLSSHKKDSSITWNIIL